MKLKPFTQSRPNSAPERNEHTHLNEALGLSILISGNAPSKEIISAQTLCKQIEHGIKGFSKDIDTYALTPIRLNRALIKANVIAFLQKLNHEIHHQKVAQGVTGVALSAEILLSLSDTLLLFHVGVTRTYFYHKDVFFLLTENHVDLNDPRNNLDAHPASNNKKLHTSVRPSNAFGLRPYLKVDAYELPLIPSDKIMSLTDTTYTQTSDLKLKAIMAASHAAEMPKLLEQEVHSADETEHHSHPPVILCAEATQEQGKKDSHSAWKLLDRFDIIRKSTLFSLLAEKEILEILSIVDLKQISASEYLIKEGAKEYDLYFVLDGQLQIRKGGKDIRRVEKGEVLGEMAAFEMIPRSADAIATRLTHVMMINHKELMELTEKDPALGVKVYKAVLREILARLRKSK